MTTFDKLVDVFRQFPGIGPRQAKRFVYFLLSREPEFIDELAHLAGTIKQEIVQCKECYRFFHKRGTSSTCAICSDSNRTSSELMIVAKDTDLEAMEKSGMYDGRYFVLGGTIPLLEAKSKDVVRIAELKSRVTALVKQGVLQEVILALSLNTEGEYTGDELRKFLSPILAGKEVKISMLGRGLSTGSELEYADKETLQSALKNRSSS
ncbi:MAG: recombination protein RecR [Candidatus Taylorbacteria bacterium CG11_big_fil_rev_8_21_14_0_20_46_11]|uniref:Recombination protein RecR n=1 Tax=Candidatus Taylorbacteria bacterium CG11_big_fil_rev_8_21_14_0_20_46_11 TaxID=1975025 RepID=A0A2H0KB68_9BACT|nr:MAG: recombination protein RecR [Candidatus Taylorbacteria bacterium CG11_big_fil_rev_8_21_14_0_20_46_11]